MRPAVLVFAAFASVAAPACSSPGAGDSSDSDALGTARSAVINGSASPSSQDSVVMIQMGDGGFCTGTLIAPNVVLTARHCVSNYAEDDCGTFTGDIPFANEGIAIGGGANEQTTPVAHAKKYFYVDGAKGLCDPAVDIAAILLDRDVTGVPIAKVRATPVTVGESFVAVGYGEDENKQVSVRRQRTGVKSVAVGPTKQTFTPTNAAAYEYELPAGEIAVTEAVCHGDSGGPLFDLQQRVVGVTSRGTDPLDVCVARPDIFSAVAQHLDVIDRALALAGHPRSETDSTASPALPGTGATDGDSTDDTGDEDTTPVKKKGAKSSLAAQPSAGCSVMPGNAHRMRDVGGVGMLAVLGLAALARRRR
jgi:hypothetical protein